MKLREKVKSLCETSIILSVLMSIIPRIYSCFREGLFGRFFTAYSKEEELWEKGKLSFWAKRKSKPKSAIRNARQYLSVYFEKSRVLKFFSKVYRYLMGCSLRFYGVFLMTYGIYVVLLYFIKQYANIFENSTGNLVAGIVMCVFALPMLLYNTTVAKLLQMGRISEFVLIDACGVPPERLEISQTKSGGKYNWAIVAGMLCGVLTLFLPPLYIVWFAGFVLIVATVMTFPEIGIISIIAALPLLSLLNFRGPWLNLAICLSCAGYIGKLIRGKRILRLGLLDISVFAFGCVVFLSGIATPGGISSTFEAFDLCIIMLLYFMIVNLLRTPAWLKRAVIAICASGTITALFDIGGYIYRAFPQSGFAQTLFGGYGENMWDVFLNTQTFSAYLILSLPFCFAMACNATTRKGTVAGLVCAFVNLTCLFLTWSRSAWICAMLAVIAFFLIYSKKTVCWLLVGGISVPIWSHFLPSAILNHLGSVGNLADSGIFKSVFTWKGSLRVVRQFLWGGIGYGEETFRQIYPLYSYNGLENAESTGSMFLSLLVSVGMIGTLVFFIISILFMQHCFEYIGNALDGYSRTYVAAGVCSIGSVLIMGFFADVWRDKITFLAFWTVIALASAFVRVGNRIRLRNSDVSLADSSKASVDLSFEE